MIKYSDYRLKYYNELLKESNEILEKSKNNTPSKSKEKIINEILKSIILDLTILGRRK